MGVTFLCLARHLISRVDIFQLLGQFVDLKFRPDRQVIADPLSPLFWCFILKSMDLSAFEESRHS
jgi:hypothetical protein